MSNLEIVFKEISKNKIKLAASPNGATFEENFKQYLRKYGFNEISKNTMDDELKSFLFSLGCYSGEPITVISHIKGGCVVSIKDARYNIDTDLARAISI